MYVSKVEYAGRVLIDLTGDNVTADALDEGVIAHDAAGAPIVGTAVRMSKQQIAALAENLRAVGVAAEENETVEVLVEKVLLALEGDGPSFAATMRPEWDVSYGIFSTGEQVSFAGTVSVSEAVRIVKLTYTITGEGIEALTARSDLWNSSTTGGVLTAVYEPGGVIPLSRLQEVLDSYVLEGDGVTVIKGWVTLTATGADGSEFTADGKAYFQYAYNMTWALAGDVYGTWGEGSATGKTWTQAAVLDK